MISALDLLHAQHSTLHIAVLADDIQIMQIGSFQGDRSDGQIFKRACMSLVNILEQDCKLPIATKKLNVLTNKKSISQTGVLEAARF